MFVASRDDKVKVATGKSLGKADTEGQLKTQNHPLSPFQEEGFFQTR